MIPRSRTLVGVAAAALIVTGLANPLQANETAAAADANLLANASFEQGSQTTELTDWSPLWIGSERYISVVTDPVTDGAQSIRILDENDAGAAGLISDPFPVSAGQVYEFSFDQLRTSGHLLPTVHFLDADGTAIAKPYAVERSTVGSWVRSSNEFTAPDGAVSARAMFYTAGAGLVDTVIDDAYFGEPREPEPEPSIPDQVTAQDPDISYLGMPVSSRITRNSVLGEENGESMTYAVYRGNKDTDFPATFVAAKTLTGEIVRTLPLTGADFATEMRASSTGKIYVTTTGKYSLWEYDPQTQKVREVGLINPSSPADGYGWSLAAAEDGRMYIGAYPKGYLYLFEPADDSITNLGAVDPTQSYVKALAYDSERDNLYVGVGGQNAQIWKVASDGTKTSLLSEEAAPGSTTQTFISTFTWTGDRLFARGNNSELLVIDADDEIEYWRGDGKEAMGYIVTERPDAPGKYIFTFQTGFWEYDSATATTRDLGIETNGYLSDARWEQRDGAWFLVGATYEGTIQVNFATGERVAQSIDYRNPIIVQKLFNGPDSMYASGYMVGLAPFDSETGVIGDTYQEGQFESAAVRGDKLLLGAYGYALLEEFDPATGAFRQIYSLREEGQDRPFGLDYDPVSDRSFMASVPYYGLHQGALTMHDFKTGETKVFKEEIVADQSFIDVLYHDGLVYIGTTIDGGLSSGASGQTDAHLIVWDPDTEQVVRDIIPVAGDEGVTGLTVGPDGLIWGVSEDTVFKYDPDAGEIVFSEKLLGNRYGSGTVWAWAYLAIGSDGNVYGTNRYSFFKIDAETMEYTRIVDGQGNYLAADDDGDVFFSSSAYLFEYDVPDAASERECTRDLEASGTTELVVSDGEVVCGTGVDIRGGVTVAEGGTLRLDGSTVRGALSADGAAEIRITATALAGSVSITRTNSAVVFSGNEVRGSLACGGNEDGVDDLGQLNEITGAVDGCALR